MSDAENMYPLTGAIDRPRTRVPYTILLALAAVPVVLLPLMYVGLVGLVGYGMYWHATVNYRVFRTGMPVFLQVIAYAVPLVIGAILLLFMVKPLFMRRSKYGPPHRLTREDEPALYAFVTDLCKAVGAPRPRRIEVDLQVNASAGLSHGVFSLFVPKDLTLTLGLPLVIGLPLTHLAGVLSHELGHLSQGAGMRFTYCIRRVSAWFAAVVYERDRVDDWVIRASRRSDWRIAAPLMLARLFVFISRTLLLVLMHISSFICAFLMRQMEYDADRCQVKVVGQEVFDESFMLVSLLEAAAGKAFTDLEATWHEKQLPDNVPAFVEANAHNAPDNVIRDLEKFIKDHKAGFLDTHPSAAQRMKSAAREEASGILKSPHAAADIFTNFEGLCREVTLEYYENVLGEPVKPHFVVPVAAVYAERKAVDERTAAMFRYFQGCIEPDFILSGQGMKFEVMPGMTVPRAAKQLHDVRERMLATVPAIQDMLREYGSLREAYRAFSSKKMKDDLAILGDYAKLARQRFNYGVRLVEMPAFLAAAADDQQIAKLADWKARLVPAFKALTGQLSSVGIVVGCLEAMGHSFEALTLGGDSEEDIGHVVHGHERLCAELGEIHAALSKIEYPFHHMDGQISTGDFLMSSRPGDDPGRSFELGRDMVQRYQELYYRVFGHLVEAAEAAETAVGLDPLPEPPDLAEPAAAT